MLALIWLAVGALLGYFVVRRVVALGLSLVLPGLVLGSLLAGRAGNVPLFTPDSVGVVVLLSLAPLGCCFGILLRARRTGPTDIAR